MALFELPSLINIPSLISSAIKRRRKATTQQSPTLPQIREETSALSPGQFGGSILPQKPTPTSNLFIGPVAPTLQKPQRPAQPIPKAPVTKPIVPVPTAPALPPPRPAKTISEAVSRRAEAVKEDPKAKILERLATGVSTVEAFKPAERLAELEAERGITARREEIGTFEQEIAKTNTFLDELESDISARTRPFGVSEAERRRILGAERAPFIKQLGIQARGLEAITGIQTREERSIQNVLAAEAEQAGIPLDTLRQEIADRKGINELFEDSDVGAQQRAVAEYISTTGDISPLSIFNALKEQFPNLNLGDIKDTTDAFKPTKLDTQIIKSGGRNLLIDKQTGETLADLGADVTAGSGVANTEFIADIMSNPSLFNSLNAKTRSALLPGLAKLGFQPVKQLTEKASGFFAGSAGVMDSINRLDELLQIGTNTGIGAATFGAIQRPFGFESEDQKAFKIISEELFKTILKLASGVAASELEVKRLKQFVPEFSAQNDVNETRVKEFKETIRKAQFFALRGYKANNLDVRGELDIYDSSILNEISGEDFDALRTQLEEGEVLAVNRETLDIEFITPDEAKGNINFLIL